MSAFFVSPRLTSGPAALEQLAFLGARKAAVVVDPALITSERLRRAVEELTASSASVETIPWSGGEPSLADTEALADRLRALAPDQIVAVGGGRTMDAAKAGWVRYARPDIDLRSVTPLAPLGLRSAAGFTAVPTTSGSGQDASWSALVRGEDGYPIELASRELVPDWSMLDPGFSATLPPEATADGVAELLTHAIEAIASEWANPFSDALGRDAVRIAFAEALRAHRHPDDLDARQALQHAATFAGLAASNAQFGVSYALAMALGPETRVSYGRLVGVLLPYVVEFDYPSVRERFARAPDVLGSDAGKDRSALSARLRALLGPLGLPRTLSEAGVPASVLEIGRLRIVARARASSATVANPRVPSEEEYARLLGAAYDGVAVGF